MPQPENPGPWPDDALTVSYTEIRQLIALHLDRLGDSLGRVAPWEDAHRAARAMRDGETPLLIRDVLSPPEPRPGPFDGDAQARATATLDGLLGQDRPDPEDSSAFSRAAAAVVTDLIRLGRTDPDGWTRDERAAVTRLYGYAAGRGGVEPVPPEQPGTVAPELLDSLRRLGDHYGPLGVALAAARLTDPAAVVAALAPSTPREGS